MHICLEVLAPHDRGFSQPPSHRVEAYLTVEPNCPLHFWIKKETGPSDQGLGLLFALCASLMANGYAVLSRNRDVCGGVSHAVRA